MRDLYPPVVALLMAMSLSSSVLAAGDPADAHPSLHLIPWPKLLKTDAGNLPLTAASRIAIRDERLRPLAEVLSGEIATLTGLKLQVTADPARAGDIVLKMNRAIKADEQLLMLRNREPERTTDGAHTITIGEQAVVEGFDYRATAEGTATILQLLGKTGNTLWLPRVTIKDWPHADYCGVMLDVARQDHPIEAIKKVVQLCRLYKARYLQLHLTDDQGWTFPSTKFPKLGTKNYGAHGGIAPRVYKTRRIEGTRRLRRCPRRDARARVRDAGPLRGSFAGDARSFRRDQSGLEAAGGHGLHEHVERRALSGARHAHRRDVRCVPLLAVLSYRQRRGHERPAVASPRLQGIPAQARPEGRTPTRRSFRCLGLRHGQEAAARRQSNGRGSRTRRPRT